MATRRPGYFFVERKISISYLSDAYRGDDFLSVLLPLAGEGCRALPDRMRDYADYCDCSGVAVCW